MKEHGPLHPGRPRLFQIAQQGQHLVAIGTGLVGHSRRGQPVVLGEQVLGALGEKDFG